MNTHLTIPKIKLERWPINTLLVCGQEIIRKNWNNPVEVSLSGPKDRGRATIAKEIERDGLALRLGHKRGVGKRQVLLNIFYLDALSRPGNVDEQASVCEPSEEGEQHKMKKSDSVSAPGKADEMAPLTITIAPAAKALVREFFLGESCSSKTKIIIQEKAKLTHYKINLGGTKKNKIKKGKGSLEQVTTSDLQITGKSEQKNITRVVQESGSYYDNFAFYKEGQKNYNKILVSQEGDQSKTNLDGLFMAKQSHNIINETKVEQKAKGGVTRQEYRGLLKDKAQAVFDGEVCVDRRAKKNQVSQFSRNLLLGRGAQIITRPKLVLNNQELKARHGASVSRPDRAHIFYLQSRGLTASAARQILIKAFVRTPLDKISDKFTKKIITREVATWI